MHPFFDFLALIFSNDGTNVFCQLTFRAILVLSQNVLDLHTCAFKFGFNDKLFGQFSRKPIQFTHNQYIEFTSPCHVKCAVQLWQIPVRATCSPIIFFEFGHDLVTLRLSIFAPHFNLSFQIASIFFRIITTDTRIQYRSFFRHSTSFSFAHYAPRSIMEIVSALSFLAVGPARSRLWPTGSPLWAPLWAARLPAHHPAD